MGYDFQEFCNCKDSNENKVIEKVIKNKLI